MIISNSRIISELADAIVSRTYEVYYYDQNIENYQATVASGSGEYPEYMSYLSGLSYPDAVNACKTEHLEEFAKIAQYLHVSHVLKTEIIERTKANGILENLITKLKSLTSEEEYEAAIAAAVARRG